MVRVRRPASLVALVALCAASCGAGAPDDDPGVAIEVVSAVADASTTTAAPSTTVSPTTTADPAVPTTTVRPPEEHETFVAHIKPEVAEIVAYVEPGGGATVPFEFAITNPTYWGNPLVLMVLDRTPDGEWLEVQIPVRPNNTTGWIPAEWADVDSHFVRAQVDLTDRSVRVWDGDQLVAESAAVIGKEATPTPLGRFFVNDLVEKWEGSAYGPYILSLSAFSEALDTFAGGIPVIAIHGTNRPELVGGAHSNGCIRVPNDVIEFLARFVPMGTPVDIYA